MKVVELACHGFVDASDLVAVGAEGDRTFADLASDVACVMRAIGPGHTRVLVTCHDRYRFTVALLAAWQGGASAWLASTSDARVERATMRDVLCLHDRGNEEGRAHNAPELDVRELLAQPRAAAGTALSRSLLHPLTPLDSRQVLVTLSTSGSTGTPVVVEKSARQLLGEAHALRHCFGQPPPSAVLSTVPPRHIYGLLFGVLWPLQLGVPFVRDTPLLPEAIVETARHTRADVLVAVPVHLSSLVATRIGDATPLRRVFSSGARLPAATFDALGERWALQPIEVLGSTETGGIAWRSSAHQPFQPFEGVRLHVDEAGDLSVSSPYLETAELPSAPPYPTGDRVRWLPDGRFEHLGRVDGVVKVGGTRVSLAAIEDRARALPGVRDAAALAVETGSARGTEVWLAVAADAWDATGLRAALAEWFEPVLLPRRYRVVDALPRTSNGKLPHAALRALFDDGSSRRTDFHILEERRSSHASAERVCIELEAPADLAYFEGHFPGHPLLPGVVQLQVLAIDNMRRAWPDLGAVREVRRLKFTRPIVPSDRLSLELHHASQTAGDSSLTRVDFKIVVEQVQCASGSVMFAREASVA